MTKTLAVRLKAPLYRLGCGELMKQARTAASRQGARLSFNGWQTRWVRDAKTLLLPAADAGMILSVCLLPTRALERFFLTPADQLEVANLTGRTLRFKTASGFTCESPTPPESQNVHTGYYLKGGPRPGDIALDGGAYIGEITLELAVSVGPEGHVFAFEPDAANRAYLLRNIAASGLKNITVIGQALWNKTTVLEFFHAQGLGSTLTGMITQDAGARTLRLPVLSPSDAFARMGRLPNFIKLDIEGAEVEVIEAMLPLLAETDVKIAIASYHAREGRPTSALLEPMLKAAGFTVETGFPEHQTTWAWREAAS